MNIVIITNSDKEIVSLVNPKLVIINNPKSPTVKISNELKVPFIVLNPKNYKNRIEYDLAIKEELDKISPDLILLSDYNKIIKSRKLLEKYHGKIINIHLSYLPEFPGYQPEKQAFEKKAKKSGFTIHIVNGMIDEGKIIYQEKVDISNCKSSKEIKTKLAKSASLALKKRLQ